MHSRNLKSPKQISPIFKANKTNLAAKQSLKPMTSKTALLNQSIKLIYWTKMFLRHLPCGSHLNYRNQIGTSHYDHHMMFILLVYQIIVTDSSSSLVMEVVPPSTNQVVRMNFRITKSKRVCIFHEFKSNMTITMNLSWLVLGFLTQRVRSCSRQA